MESAFRIEQCEVAPLRRRSSLEQDGKQWSDAQLAMLTTDKELSWTHPFGGAEDELAESIQDGQDSSDEPRLEIANQILILTRPIHEQRLGHELHHAFLAPWSKSCAV